MMLSLLETIFVMFLMEKDAALQDKEADRDKSPSDDYNNQGKADFHSCHGGETYSQLFVNCFNSTHYF